MQNDTLNLYVSPYLKEFHKTIAGFSMKRGNFPKEISHMGAKFLKFLNTLKEYSADQTRPMFQINGLKTCQTK